MPPARTLPPPVTARTDAHSRLAPAGWPEESEREVRHLAAVVESSDDAIVTATPAGLVTSWNRGAEQVFGYSAQEALGQHISMIGPPDQADEIAEKLDRLNEGHPVDHHEAKRMRKDGVAIDVSLSLSPILDDAGAVVGIASIIRDITGSRRDEEMRRHLAAVAESTEDAVISKTLGGTILFWNRAAERLYGYPAEEAVGKSIELIVPADHHDEIEEILSEIKQGRPVDQLETTRVRKDGQRLEVSLTVSPIRDADGRVVGASSIARDVTDRKRMEVDLAGTRSELERSNGDLLEFAYVASHELVEPVRVVAGYADLLQRRYGDRLDEDGGRFIDAVASGAERMQALIHDLLQFSRLGNQGKPMARLDCDELVRDILLDLEHRLAEADATASVEELPTITADAGELGLVFRNLLVNALKFRSEDPPEIRVSADLDDSGWRFSVRDNGIGIKPADAERVFDMFQRLNGRDQFGGTGMGLALVKRIVQRHGGRVWIDQAPGGGTVVSFTMPDQEVVDA